VISANGANDVALHDLHMIDIVKQLSLCMFDAGLNLVCESIMQLNTIEPDFQRLVSCHGRNG
jgi:hypothetical protein